MKKLLSPKNGKDVMEEETGAKTKEIGDSKFENLKKKLKRRKLLRESIEDEIDFL